MNEDGLRLAKLSTIEKFLEDVITASPISSMRFKKILAEELMGQLDELEVVDFEANHVMALEEEYRERFGEIAF